MNKVNQTWRTWKSIKCKLTSKKKRERSQVPGPHILCLDIIILVKHVHIINLYGSHLNLNSGLHRIQVAQTTITEWVCKNSLGRSDTGYPKFHQPAVFSNGSWRVLKAAKHCMILSRNVNKNTIKCVWLSLRHNVVPWTYFLEVKQKHCALAPRVSKDSLNHCTAKIDLHEHQMIDYQVQ